MNKTLLTLILISSSTVSSYGAEKLDVCDVSFLWPVPRTKVENDKLISITEKLTKTGDAIVPPKVFDQVIEHAQKIEIKDGNKTLKIGFDPGDLKKIENWKLAAIRIDPSAPGCSSKIRIDQNLGSTPQIRLIFQPVLVSGDSAVAHDYTMHVLFSYVTSRGLPGKPDTEQFNKIVKSLHEIKMKLSQDSINTTGAKLGVHPGFKSSTVDLTQLLREFFKQHLESNRISAIAFMGLDMGDTWIFFASSRNSTTDNFDLLTTHPSLVGSPAQFVSFVTDNNVVPKPTNRQFGAAGGVATEQLFPVFNPDKLLFPAATDSPLKDIRVKHIPDIVANPDLSHFFTTDCVSCHTESTLRKSKFNGAFTDFAYKLPSDTSGVDPDVLPTHQWNVRNFGWGFKSRNNMVPTVTMRTTNEAAESAHFINEHYPQ